MYKGDSDFSHEVTHKKIIFLYKNLLFGVGISLIASVVIFLEFGKNHNGESIWFFTLISVLVARLCRQRIWNSKHKLKTEIIKELFIFRLGVMTTALLWSIYFLLSHKYFDIYEVTFSMIIIAILTGSAAVVLASDKFISITYTITLLIPYSLLLLMDERQQYNRLGELGIFFSLVMILVTIKSANSMISSIELKYEYKGLLRNLENEVKKRTKKIYYLTQHDSLTHLLNRAYFIEKSENILKYNYKNQYYLFFIDLNDFKYVNDNFGHLTGDALLKNLASRFRKKLSSTCLICRWGGDEFIILSEFHSEQDLDEMVQQIFLLIEETFYIKNNVFEISASVGISQYPAFSRDIHSLILQADMAMYHAKFSNNRKYLLFNKSMMDESVYKYKLSSKLKTAIEKKQLSIMFQPILNVKENKFDSAEILLRWHIDGESIPPDVFIPLAEQTGDINKIGLWVLETAIIHARELDEIGISINICVNVSAIQFKESYFLDAVFCYLRKFDFPSNRLKIELTESVFSDSNEKVFSSIKALQKQGVKISIDDFGTGYSSLSLVQNLNVDTVKIDKSFISEIDRTGLNIVQAVMVISNGFGFNVVAEGVEELHQMEILASMGVPYLQGYLFCKPIPFAEFISFMKEHPLN
ncbi:bifunctional diguanylate cyclase/phosphodiesterase [Pectobacterium cacticida]|uniref:putative bifunctional diguanylate cyclase/phosphodiesterase n=1 Tax=Pectobacterium cacticida TaxID=69221 RepID=UPI002FF396AA